MLYGKKLLRNKIMEANLKYVSYKKIYAKVSGKKQVFLKLLEP